MEQKLSVARVVVVCVLTCVCNVISSYVCETQPKEGLRRLPGHFRVNVKYICVTLVICKFFIILSLRLSPFSHSLCSAETARQSKNRNSIFSCDINENNVIRIVLYFVLHCIGYG